MRDDGLKSRLRQAFPGPDPVRKRAFWRKMPPPPVSHLRFLARQAGYVRPATWLASLAVFAGALGLGRLLLAERLWVPAALTPFAALAAVAESGRSAFYGMEELELASRMGLRDVTLARMGAVGLVHLVLLAALAAALGDGSFFRTGTYLLTPYLLTDLTGLAAVRRIRGREALYACGGAAVLTAGLAAGLSTVQGAYDPAGLRWWAPVLAAAAGLTAWEYTKTIRKTEELS